MNEETDPKFLLKPVTDQPKSIEFEDLFQDFAINEMGETSFEPTHELKALAAIKNNCKIKDLTDMQIEEFAKELLDKLAASVFNEENDK